MTNIIPPEAFASIIKELERQPIAINEYRNKSGSGRSQAFGIVNRRNLPPDYSRQCWLRPYLYHLLLEFGKTYVTDISFNAITVNQNYKAEPHRDKNNRGNSFLVAFGDYSGGELELLEGERKGVYDINCKPMMDDFSKVLHSVKEFSGDRYSLVYYQFENKRLGVLPEGSVKREGDKYYFYRGDNKITRAEGLPHNLKGKKKEVVGLKIENKEVVIVFD